MDERPYDGILEPTRRSAILPDGYVLQKDDAELVSFLLAGQNFSYSESPGGELHWGAFGRAFRTLGEVRALALANPPADEPALPVVEESDTVGLELFGNMLDTISFLRVRLRALADVVIEKGIVSGPELLGKYHEYHEKSFEAFRDIMLLRPEVFETRFASWIATEKEYRTQLAADREAAVEP
ncbi:MAG: hypothetical protein NVS2B3_19750 [Vulcanimicrobiaceae bacterium]